MSAFADLGQLPLVQRFGWVLIHSVWQGVACALVLALALAVMRRASPNARYVAGCIALVAFAAAAFATFLVLRPEPPSADLLSARHEVPVSSFASRFDRPVNSEWRRADKVATPALRAVEVRASASTLANVRGFAPWVPKAVPWLVAGWLFGVSALSLRLIGGWFEVQGMKRRRTAPARAEWQRCVAEVARKLGVSRPVRLLESALAEVPLVIGWLRPVVLLPASVLTGLTREQVQALLAHELAHIRRHDYLVNLLQSVLETVLFYHPALWWIGRRIRQERENACDDLAVQICGDRLSYARTLAMIEEMRNSQVELAPAASGGSLLSRIRRLLEPGARREPLTAWLAAGFVAALIALTAIAGIMAPARALGEKPAANPLIGTILDTGGRVIMGARGTLILSDFTTGETTQLSSVTADRSGRFQFDLPVARRGQKAAVWIEAPGFAMTFREVRAQPEPVKVVLDPPATLDVRTIDESGKPVAGVRLQPDFFFKEPLTFQPVSAPMAERLTLLTDERGLAHFANLPRDARFNVKIAEPRFATPSLAEQSIPWSGEQARPVTITLLPAATIRGQVRYRETGLPAPGVRVAASGAFGESPGGTGTTGADGGYEIGQLRPGTYDIVIHLPDELAKSWTAEAREKVVVAKAGQVGAIDFDLVPGAVLTGRITAAEDGEPIPNVPVGIHGPAFPASGGAVRPAWTGDDGRFTMRVPAGAQTVFIWGKVPGYRPPATKTYEVTVGDGETHNVDFQLPRRAPSDTVFIRVRDVQGDAAPDAEVFVNSEALGSSWDWVAPDATGKLRLEVDDFSKPPRLRARHRESATIAPVAINTGGEVTLPLAPKAFGRLRGKVVDADGKPIAGVKLVLFDGGTGSDAALSRNDGSFEIREVWPAATVFVEANGMGWTRETSESFVLKAGEARELSPLLLKPATLEVAGRVVDEKGAPLPGLRVHLHATRSPDQDTTTDHEGRFRFAGVAGEAVKLFTGTEGGASATATCAAGKTDLEIVATVPPPNPEPTDKPLRTGPAQGNPDAAPPAAEEVSPIAWGSPRHGLRSGISYRTERGPFKPGSMVGLVFTIENVGAQPISLTCPPKPDESAATLQIEDSTGRELIVPVQPSDYPVRHGRITLQPAEKVAVGTAEFVIQAAGIRMRGTETTFSAEAGKYRLRHVRTFRKSEEGDWTGQLTTDVLGMTIADPAAATGGAKPDAAALLEKAKREASPEAKTRTIRQLTELAYEPASQFFIDSLRDPNATVRMEAAKALGSLETPLPAPVTRALDGETDGSVIQQLVLALEIWGSWEEIPSLKKAAGKSGEQARTAVLRTIGRLGDDGDVSFLARHLDDASASVVSAAAGAIQHITGETFETLPSVEAPIRGQRAREWWKTNRAKYEAADNESAVYVTAQLLGTAYEEALAAEKSGQDRRKTPDAQPDPKAMSGKLKPYEEVTLRFGHQQFYVTKVVPVEFLQRHLRAPFFIPSEFESETLGATITLNVHRRQGRILFSGKCEIPRLEAETPKDSKAELVSSSTVTRAARFTGAADPGKPVRIDLGDRSGSSQLTLTFLTAPPK